MTALSNYCENALLDHVLGTTAFTKPTNTYVKLHTGDPGEDGTGNAAGETTRKILSWAAASAGSIAIDTALQWTSVASSETYSHVSVWDALTGGNLIAYGALSSSQVVNSGDTFDIASGAITLSFAQTMFTLAAANNALEHITGRTAWTVPAGSFVKLHTGAPGNASTANAATETDRISATWDSASGGSASNDGAIDWSSVAATEDITHVSVWDASTSGNALLNLALSSTKSLTSGQDARIADAQLTATLA